jgi:hypothetical protein
MYFLCCSVYFCVVLWIDCIVSFSVLFVCICVLNYCHRVATQLQLNISYHINNSVYFVMYCDMFRRTGVMRTNKMHFSYLIYFNGSFLYMFRI